jgi:glycosyltransferase involved in cell wall biosynthesis
MKVYIYPLGSRKKSDGISQVIYGQMVWLPTCGIEIVPQIETADVVATHINNVPRDIHSDQPLVVSNHGVYWTNEQDWGRWADSINQQCIQAAMVADVLTVPSKWVQNAMAWGLNKKAKIVYHGIDIRYWEPQTSEGYILWNKSRVDPACDSEIVNRLADRVRDKHFVTTYGRTTHNVEVIGAQDHNQMRNWVSKAAVYLDPVKETGGPCFGLLETMACAVPTLAWNNGGNAEVIIHKETGYLAEEGNEKDLIEGLHYCLANRVRLGQAARQQVIDQYQWKDVIWGYVDAFEEAIKNTQHATEVSVVCTCYNKQDYIAGAIESVLQQDFEPFELIVVDDGSTDKSPDIIDSYSNPKLKVIHQSNQHVSEARNQGILQAKGKYILPLDGDDQLLPDAIKNLYQAIESNRGLQLVTGTMLCQQDEKQFVSGWPPVECSYEEQLRGRNQFLYASLFKKQVWKDLGGYRRRIRTGVEDADFWTRCLTYGRLARHKVEKPTLYYRIMEETLSSTNRNPVNWIDWFAYVHNRPPFGAFVFEGEKPKIFGYDNSKVTVLIPVLEGQESYLQTCLDSLINQVTPVDYSLIVINGTGKDISYFIMGFPQAQVIESEIRTIGACLNVGLEQTKTKYFITFSALDVAQPNMINQFLNTQADWAYCDWLVDKTVKEASPIHKIFESPVGCSTAFYTKSNLRFHDGLNVEAGWYYQRQLIQQKQCPTLVEEPLVISRTLFNLEADQIQYIKQKVQVTEEMCKSCGGGSRKKSRPVKTFPQVPENPDRLLIEYTGTNIAVQSMKSSQGGQYRYGAGHRQFMIYKEDWYKFSSYPYFRIIPTKMNEPVVPTVTANAVWVDQEQPVVNKTIDNRLLSELNIKPELVSILANHSITNVEQLKLMTDEALLAIKGVGPSRLKMLRESYK